MLWTEVIMRKDLQLKWAIRSNRFELYMATYHFFDNLLSDFDKDSHPLNYLNFARNLENQYIINIIKVITNRPAARPPSRPGSRSFLFIN